MDKILKLFQDGSVPLCDLVLVAIALLWAFCQPDFLSRWLKQTMTPLIRTAEKYPTGGYFLIGLLAFLGSASLSIGIRMPEPTIHDEFSYLLAADTFSHGRLANPVHPMWRHFESLHILQQPTYASMYPPGQGFVLAIGQVLFGHPLVGVWLGVGIMCALIPWMLAAWVPLPWALLGGILTVIRIGLVSYWAQSYWGGAVAAIGGALVFGALPRMIRSGHLRQSWLLGLGLAILTHTRPYEGLVAGLPAGLWLLVWMLGQNGPARKEALRQILIPLFILMGLTAAGMGYYNWRVTGNPAELPYLAHARQYVVMPHFLWQAPGPEPEYRHTLLRRFHVDWELTLYTEQQSLSGFLSATLRKIKLLWVFYVGLILSVPLVMVFRLCRDRPLWPALIPCFLSILSALFLETWLSPHYLAPIACLFLLILTSAMQHLSEWQWRGRPLGLAVVQAIPILLLFSLVIQYDRQPWLYPQDPIRERAKLVRRLNADDSRHLILVRYGPQHSVHREWVYNEADIDGSKVVWAREMGPMENAALVSYFRDRRIWLLEIDQDSAPVKLIPYSSSQTGMSVSPFAGRQEKDGEIAGRLADRSGGALPHIPQAVGFKDLAQGLPVEAVMIDTGGIAMKAAVLRIEVGQTEPAAGTQRLYQPADNGSGIQNVVQGHGRDDQVIAPGQRLATGQIQTMQGDILPAGLLHLGPHGIQHPLGSVHTGQRAHLRTQGQSHQTRTAAEIEDIHRRRRRDFSPYGSNNVPGQLATARLQVPGGSLTVEIPRFPCLFT